MKDDEILVILGNQLFPIDNILKVNCRNIFMAEDMGLCTDFKHHKLKILMFLTSMREYRDNLIKNGFNVFYFSIEDIDFNLNYEEKIFKTLKSNNFKKLHFFNIENLFFSKKFFNFFSKKKLKMVEHVSPMFLCNKNDFVDFSNSYKSLRMENFYKFMRRKLNILIEKDGKPVGNRWSFDSENRKRLPKIIEIPNLPSFRKSKYTSDLKKIIEKKFNHHPGDLENLWMPLTRKDALDWLENFLNFRMNNFGSYEDAISTENNFLFHSALSPILNMGLLTPNDVIEKALNFHDLKSFPINSFEGFIRQIIGWREFIRGIYFCKGNEERTKNFWGFKRKISDSFYKGNTGIEPVDDTIKKINKTAYAHHIERLMIMGNFMLLCEFDPDEVYKWFMELFIDAYDWVMVPNVYGMSQFADGGLMSTKPYISGSNYILKMSNYKKGDWCIIWDSLFWNFIDKKRTFFEKNPRMRILVRSFDKMDTIKKTNYLKCAEDYLLSIDIP